MRSDLPSGTVTFLFTDVEGSTKLLHELGAKGYAEALAEHRRVVREACASQGGVEVDTQGDAFFFAFPSAPSAVAAATQMTEALDQGPIQVRIGLHTGTPLLTEEGYVGDDVHRAARIAASGHGGQVLVSSSTAHLVEIELTDLGEHRFKDLSAPERVYQLGDGDFPALKSLYRTNLPVPATPFLGRERELAEVLALLEGTRLLTLTGPGGTGKTRLALQAAATAAESFPDGVVWVPLAPVRDPELVLPAVAQALEVKELSGISIDEALRSALSGKQMLMLLDNVEHLLPDVAGELSTLLETPGPTLLVTSRERIQLLGEHVYPVPTLEASDGVSLFLARARSLDPGFEANGAVGELCARLDHLPLALELAAARTAVFSPEQLLERLSQRLDLLKGGRGMDPRQQTLRATIEWSYELLEPHEQRLLGALSVFVGGCTYEAAEEVCGADPDTLQSLLDKSLIRRRDSELGPRYWMLETIKAFAWETLAADERRRLSDAHLELFTADVEALGWSARQRDAHALAFLRTEQANVVDALDWALQTKATDAAQTILIGSWYYWVANGLAEEGDRWASEIVELPSEPTLKLAQSLSLAGEFARSRGDSERAIELKLRSLPVFDTLGPEHPEVAPWLAATLTDMSESLAMLGDIGRAEEFAERALEIRRELGDPGRIAHALAGCAFVAECRGSLEEAALLFAESVAILDEAGERFEAASPLIGLASVRRRLGELPEAAAAFVSAHERALESGDLIHLADSLAGMGLVAADDGRAHEAVQLLARAQCAFSDLGLVVPDADEINSALEMCRGELGEEAYRLAYAAGVASARVDR